MDSGLGLPASVPLSLSRSPFAFPFVRNAVLPGKKEGIDISWVLQYKEKNIYIICVLCRKVMGIRRQIIKVTKKMHY